MGFEAFRFRERFKGGLPPGIVPPKGGAMHAERAVPAGTPP